MQLFACFWIALCLVVDTSTKSVTISDDETSIEDLPIPLHGNADGIITAEQCKCENGVCKENDNGKFVCTCPSEWGFLTLSHCQKCECGKDSNCTFSGFWVTTKTCICKVGYEDKDGFCKGTCKVNPCLNGGQCKVQGDDIECECKNSFIGKRCEKDEACITKCGVKEDVKCIKKENNIECKCIDNDKKFDHRVKECRVPCMGNSNCTNGASCKESQGEKFCECYGTSGDACETILDCTSTGIYRNCTGGLKGTCKFDTDEYEAICVCKRGTAFKKQYGSCAECDCGTNSRCSFGEDDQKKCRCGEKYKEFQGKCYECDCGTNSKGCFFGEEGNKYCECKYKYTEFEGKCNECDCGSNSIGCFFGEKGNKYCQCRDKYTEFEGKCYDCECGNYSIGCSFGENGKKKCECKEKYTEFQGKCLECDCGSDSIGCSIGEDGKKKCECKEKYMEVQGKCYECDCGSNSIGCSFGEDSKKKCECKDKYKEVQGKCYDVCSPNPCQNGGICDARGGEAACQCKDRFRGADCSIDVCSPNPCQNGGICNATRGEATCQCKDRFRGADCSIDVCSPNPCRNGGVCNATREGVICQCKDRFIGADCSMEIPLISTSTSTIQPTHHPTSSPSGHSLNSTVRRESTLRLTTLVPTIGVDPCTESPCQNGGTCVILGNRPKCLCKKPYLGNLCETDPCDWNPCKNGGVCKTEYETVRCFCREPFIGEFCESLIRTDTYVIGLVAGSVFLAVLLIFVTCILCQRYHVMRTRSEYC